MTKRIRNLFVAILSCLLVAVACVGMVSLVKADITVITMTGTAEANVKTAEKSGLKFSAVIDKNEYQTLTQDKDAKVGMIIVPTDHLNAALSQGLDFTIEKLSAYAPFEGYAFYDYAETVKDNGDKYQFWMTVPNISGSNYNRDFSARAFIELTDENGVSYVYADYDEENARNVYEVAYSAYTDGAIEDQTGKEIAKTFIDGVAVLEYDEDNGEVKIANNVDGVYTAPYSLTKNYIDGDYYVTQKAVTYNGQRVIGNKIKDDINGIELFVSKSDGATINADGSVTLEGRQLTGGTSWDVGVRALNNSYISFEGDYGVGTYIDFTYTGNNMPLVMLFANNINGDMSCGNDSKEDFENNGAVNNGYIIMNGAYTKTSWNATDGNIYSIRYGDRVMCIGPYRNSPTLSLASYNSGTSWPVSDATISDNINEIEQSYLATDNSGDQYKYTVGSFVKDGFVYIDLKVKNLTTGVNLGEKSWSTGKTETEIEMLGSNIVVYGCIKENYQENTTFSFSSPYQSIKDGVKTYEARFNKDGSVSLDSNYPIGGYGISSVNAIKNSYIAFEGDYGVGTYVEFTFTGNNLPQVCLFANNISGDMSQGDVSTKVNTGYLLMNGMYYTSKDVPNGDIRHPNYLVYFGPNRHASDWNYGALDWRLGITSDTNFHQETLKNNPNQLKYTVGSYLDADLTVIIEVSLYDLTNDTLLKTATIDTGKTQTEVEALGGNIIAYGCCKGGIEPTTFKYTAPYTK